MSFRDALDTFHIVFWVAGTILPSGVAAHVILSRQPSYALWAKILWIIGSLLGYAWGILGWVEEHSRDYGLDARMYHSLKSIRWFVWGVLCGLVLPFALAARRGGIVRTNQTLQPTAGREENYERDIRK
jgi:hypothetical protein